MYMVKWVSAGEGLELRGLRDVACLNIFHGKHNRVAESLQHFVCEKGFIRRKIIYHLQGCIGNEL